MIIDNEITKKLRHCIRTNNFKDADVMGKISSMWKQALADLGNGNGSIYGVYHDYEGDYKCDYSLGVATSADHLNLEELQQYQIFKADPNDPEGILNAWKQVWELEEHGSLKRAYTYDFEKYEPSGEVSIYIAIKE